MHQPRLCHLCKKIFIPFQVSEQLIHRYLQINISIPGIVNSGLQHPAKDHIPVFSLEFRLSRITETRTGNTVNLLINSSGFFVYAVDLFLSEGIFPFMQAVSIQLFHEEVRRFTYRMAIIISKHFRNGNSAMLQRHLHRLDLRTHDISLMCHNPNAVCRSNLQNDCLPTA